MPVKGVVSRIKEAYESLPMRAYQCEKTRGNNGICFWPGSNANQAYEALLSQLRKYSMINLGDYRTVKYRGF